MRVKAALRSVGFQAQAAAEPASPVKPGAGCTIAYDFVLPQRVGLLIVPGPVRCTNGFAKAAVP
jgi:hypothetical protein